MRMNDLGTQRRKELRVDPVGRETELTVLRAALDDVIGGVGRVVLISGDPGIGKSTIVDAFRADAVDAGATWLWGAAWEDLGAPAYLPWIQVVRAAGRVAPDPVAARTQDLGPLGPAGPSATVPEQFVLYDAVADLLASLGERAPVVVVLEDLHAAGVATARLLEFVARFDRHVPVLLIGTYRPAEAATDVELAAALARLEDVGTPLTPAPLTAPEIAAVIEAAGTRAEPALVTEVAERTQGNPLFVSHVARRLAAGGSTADSGLPLGLGNAYRRQAERITSGSAAPEALDVAAVLGVDLDFGVLAAVLDTEVAQIRPVLDDAVAAGLLRADPTTPERYAFAHAVARDALHDGISPARRAELHLLTAHALKAVGTGPDRLAHHFASAWPAGGASEAAEQCRLAGHRATAVHAHAEAVASFRDALTALGRVPDASPVDRGGLLVELAAAQFRAGRTSEGRVTAGLASDLAESIGDVELMGRAALLVASNLPFNAVDNDAIVTLRRADDRWEHQASATRAAVLARLAGITAPVDRVEAAALAARAEDVAMALGTDVAERDRSVALAAALTAQIEVAWGRHDPEQARATARRLGGTAVEAADEAAAMIWDATFSLELGDLPAAADAVRSLEQLALRERQPALRHLALSRRAMLTILRGDLERGLQLSLDAREVAAGAGLPDADAVCWGQLYAVWKLAGLADDADADLMERIATDLAEHSPFVAAHASAVVLMLLAHGDEAAARQLFERTFASLDSLDHDLLYAWTLAVMADSAVALGASEAAGILYDRLLPFADRFVVGAGAVVCIGSASHQLGELARLLGRHEAARQHLAAALRAHQEAGCTALAAASERAYAALTPTAAAFDQDGQVVTARYGPDVARLPVSLGLRYLTVLVDNPGVDVESTHLVAVATGNGGDGARIDAATSLVRSPDAVLDTQALASYRSRLADLDAELDESSAWHDDARTSRLEEERGFLLDELSRAVGLRGRPRRFADESERARVNVTRAIRSAIRKIEAQAPGLASHLDRCVTTGGRCCYDPDLAESS
jgi:tetratricopeptide (TPR) repeat protein